MGMLLTFRMVSKHKMIPPTMDMSNLSQLCCPNALKNTSHICQIAPPLPPQAAPQPATIPTLYTTMLTNLIQYPTCLMNPCH